MRFVQSLPLLLIVSSVTAPSRSQEDAPPRESLFDGRTFAGWLHEDSHWRIDEGAIAGEIPDGEILRRNLFLFWDGELHDFDLELEFRISGDPSANSGVQFRSRRLDDGGAAGYQADIDDGAVWLGRIYDEHGRALIAERGTEAWIGTTGARASITFRDAASYRALFRPGEWNSYRVRAVGPRIETFINGERATVLIDKQSGEADFSGRLALQLHSGPGPAKIEFRSIELARLGETALPPAEPAVERSRDRGGVVPLGADGRALNLGFETGTLEDWTATGDAWDRQPVRGDTVTPRRPGQASEHAGEFWAGGYEVLGDRPTGVLESAPFAVTHPFASFLAGGGSSRSTRVEIVDVDSGSVIHSRSGRDNENLELAVVDLGAHAGKRIAVRVVDESSGAWGHVNYDDFRFHSEAEGALAVAATPRRVHENPLLDHLQRNTVERPPRTDAERSVANFYLPEGFRAELIASEPDLVQPIAFAFDERGRVWVAEALSYPQRRPQGEGEDRIVIFDDADGDGSYETRKVFARGLNLVSGLAVGHGGAWVGAAPYLLFLPDADSDDVPDSEPVVVLDGWGYQDTHETPNSFTWGPDGWLYGNHGVFNTSQVGKPGAAASERITLYAAVWRYHPLRETFEVFAHGGSNQWGLDFDEHGELFITHCRSYWGGGPTTHVVLRGHYWNQANARHAPFVSGDHPPGVPHLRNFLRASARYGHGEGGAGLPGSRALYGGHSHVGTMIYLGDNWPAEHRGHLFTHNLHGHQVNRQVNERRGAGYETFHAGSDLLFVDDPAYVAVDLDYGPDGSVLIIDWYDRQHCHSPHMERWDRSNGRIYRVSYAPTFTPRKVDLGAASDFELVRLHSHANAWYARTARRLLAERAAARSIDPIAIAELRSMLASGEAESVLGAMWTLHCAGELDADLRRALLAHASEHVRAWAVRLSGDGRELEPDELRALAELARSDGSGLVRLAIASAMPAVPAGPAWRLASALAARAEDADDAYMPRMIWFGIAPHVAGDLDRAFRLAETTRLPALGDFIRWYAATTNQGLDRALASLGGDPETADPETIAHRLGLVAFARRDAWLREPPAIWSAISAQLYAHDDARIRARAESLGASFSDGVVLAKLRASLGESDTRPAERRRAFDVLSRSADRESLPRFLELVDDPAFTSDAITVLARYDAPEIPVVLLARFARLSSGDRQRALATLTARASFAVPLLEVIAAGAVDRKALTSFHIRQLRSLRDKRADALVAELWGDAREASDDVRARIAELGKTYRDAPLWAFESAGGKASFDKLCASCHASTDSAGELGPDLAGSGRNGAEYFLESILDPNAVVGEDFRLSVIVTKTGSVLSGVVREETPERLTLRTPTERIVIEKSAIASREKQSASLMPEGLLDTLEERQVIELLKYLSGL